MFQQSDFFDGKDKVYNLKDIENFEYRIPENSCTIKNEKVSPNIECKCPIIPELLQIMKKYNVVIHGNVYSYKSGSEFDMVCIRETNTEYENPAEMFVSELIMKCFSLSGHFSNGHSDLHITYDDISGFRLECNDYGHEFIINVINHTFPSIEDLLWTTCLPEKAIAYDGCETFISSRGIIARKTGCNFIYDNMPGCADRISGDMMKSFKQGFGIISPRPKITTFDQYSRENDEDERCPYDDDGFPDIFLIHEINDKISYIVPWNEDSDITDIINVDKVFWWDEDIYMDHEGVYHYCFHDAISYPHTIRYNQPGFYDGFYQDQRDWYKDHPKLRGEFSTWLR